MCGNWEILWSSGMIGFEVRNGIFPASNASLSTSDVLATNNAISRDSFVFVRLALASGRLCFDPLDLCIFIRIRSSSMIIS